MVGNIFLSNRFDLLPPMNKETFMLKKKKQAKLAELVWTLSNSIDINFNL